MSAVASGELAAAEANDLGGILAAYVKTLEATDFETRLRALEAKAADDHESSGKWQKLLQQRLSRLKWIRSEQPPSIICTLTMVGGTAETGPIEEYCDCAEVDGQVWHRQPDETLANFKDRVKAELSPDAPFTLIAIFQEKNPDDPCNAV